MIVVFKDHTGTLVIYKNEYLIYGPKKLTDYVLLAMLGGNDLRWNYVESPCQLPDKAPANQEEMQKIIQKLQDDANKNREIWTPEYKKLVHSIDETIIKFKEAGVNTQWFEQIRCFVANEMHLKCFESV